MYKGGKTGVRQPMRNKDTVEVCRDEIMKAKDHRDLSLTNYFKGNKKSWYRYNSSKRNPRENVNLLLNGDVDLYKKPQRWASSPWLLHLFLLLVSSIPHTGGQEEDPEKGKLILCEGGREHLDKLHAHVPGTWWDAPTNPQGADQCHCEASLDHLWKVVVTRRGFHLKGEATVGANVFKVWIIFLPFWDGTHNVFQTCKFLLTASIVLIKTKFLWDGEALLSTSSFQGNWREMTCSRSEMKSTLLELSPAEY